MRRRCEGHYRTGLRKRSPLDCPSVCMYRCIYFAGAALGTTSFLLIASLCTSVTTQVLQKCCCCGASLKPIFPNVWSVFSSRVPSPLQGHRVSFSVTNAIGQPLSWELGE